MTMDVGAEVGTGGSSVVEIDKMVDEQRSVERSMEEGSLTKRAEEKAGPSTWEVEIEHMLERTDPSLEMERWKKTSIYRVPAWTKDITNKDAYRPCLVSLGPFHHGDLRLLPMEEHKRRAMLHLVKRSGKTPREFIAAMEDVADTLLDSYDGLDDKWRGEDRGRFLEVMVTDGCFLLEIMSVHGGEGNDYAANDPVFSLHGLLSTMVGIQADMVVVENQVPLLALERLVAVQHGMPPNCQQINRSVLQYLDRPLVPGMYELGLHPLDLFHWSFCGGHRELDITNEPNVIMPTAMELSEAGIRLKACESPWVHKVDFENGVLSIPSLMVHDTTEKELLNLMVFERLHAGAGSDVTNYLIFMDQIIESDRDVTLLRSTGIITNCLNSDKMVADMFDKLTMGAISSPSDKLHNVQKKLKAHSEKIRHRWCAIFVQKYLSTPWVFLSLVGAFILLIATITQTVYTVVPFYTKG